MPLADTTKVIGQNATQHGFIHEETDVERRVRELYDIVESLQRAIQSPERGLHNEQTYVQQKARFDRVVEGDSYKDRSLIMIMPGYKPLATAVWASFLNLLTPANHQLYRMYMSNYEVGQAYEEALGIIMSDPNLSKFSYILTVEADNIVPPMAVMQMFEDMDASGVDVLGAMYWVKGPGGAPMAYGKFGEVPHSFKPFIPTPHSVSRVNGVGMGCTLFKTEIFRKISRPWFKTYQEWTPHVGMESLATQDLFFARKAVAEAGIKFAVTTNVLVGHLDEKTGIVW